MAEEQFAYSMHFKIQFENLLYETKYMKTIALTLLKVLDTELQIVKANKMRMTFVASNKINKFAVTCMHTCMQCQLT